MINPEHEGIISREERDPKTVRFHPLGFSYVKDTKDNHPVFESKPVIISGLLSSRQEIDEIEYVQGWDTRAIHRTRVEPLSRRESFASSRVGKLIKKVTKG